MWVRQIYKERKQKGEYHRLVKEAMLSDHELYFRMFRMLPNKFQELLLLVAPSLIKPNARREPIGPSECLAVTLQYLVIGDAFITIGNSYRMSDTIVGRIVKKTCRVLWDVLLENGYLKCPSSKSEWRRVAEDFETSGIFRTVLVPLTANMFLYKVLPIVVRCTLITSFLTSFLWLL